MSKYEALTSYIPKLNAGDFGEWVEDKVNDGTPEHPKQFPFVAYSDIVRRFYGSIFRFCEDHPEYENTEFQDVLAANQIEWNSESMENAEVDCLDGKAIIALLVGTCRGERYCEGVLLDFLNSGTIMRWLMRLKEIDG